VRAVKNSHGIEVRSRRVSERAPGTLAHSIALDTVARDKHALQLVPSHHGAADLATLGTGEVCHSRPLISAWCCLRFIY
jgi:hypothetical protein